jgi:hypothetical protein
MVCFAVYQPFIVNGELAALFPLFLAFFAAAAVLPLLRFVFLCQPVKGRPGQSGVFHGLHRGYIARFPAAINLFEILRHLYFRPTECLSLLHSFSNPTQRERMLSPCTLFAKYSFSNSAPLPSRK